MRRDELGGIRCRNVDQGKHASEIGFSCANHNSIAGHTDWRESTMRLGKEELGKVPGCNEKIDESDKFEKDSPFSIGQPMGSSMGQQVWLVGVLTSYILHLSFPSPITFGGRLRITGETIERFLRIIGILSSRLLPAVAFASGWRLPQAL